MVLKILIRRTFKPGTFKDASEMLIRARTNAMAHKGYISSETLSSCSDPNTLLVLSMWENKESWDSYANSEERMDNERKFAEILEGETTYEEFYIGMPPY